VVVQLEEGVVGQQAEAARRPDQVLGVVVRHPDAAGDAGERLLPSLLLARRAAAAGPCLALCVACHTGQALLQVHGVAADAIQGELGLARRLHTGQGRHMVTALAGAAAGVAQPAWRAAKCSYLGCCGCSTGPWLICMHKRQPWQQPGPQQQPSPLAPHLDHEDGELVHDALPLDVVLVQPRHELVRGVQRDDLAEHAVGEAEGGDELVAGAEGAARRGVGEQHLWAVRLPVVSICGGGACMMARAGWRWRSAPRQVLGRACWARIAQGEGAAARPPCTTSRTSCCASV
jgi:hypothetical protein